MCDIYLFCNFYNLTHPSRMNFASRLMDSPGFLFACLHSHSNPRHKIRKISLVLRLTLLPHSAMPNNDVEAAGSEMKTV